MVLGFLEIQFSRQKTLRQSEYSRTTRNCDIDTEAMKSEPKKEDILDCADIWKK